MRLQGSRPRDALYYIAEPFFQNNAAVGTLKNGSAMQYNASPGGAAARLNETVLQGAARHSCKNSLPSRNAAWGLHGNAIFQRANGRIVLNNGSEM